MGPPDYYKPVDAVGPRVPWTGYVFWLVTTLAVLAGILFFLYPQFVAQRPAKGAQSTQIGIATWPGFAPSFLAKERGYFGDVNVGINVLDDFSARQAAFISGKTDFTIYTIDSLAFDAGKGVRGKIVLILDRSNGADGIVATTSIGSIADLKGKKVAYTRGSPAHFLLVSALARAGLTINDIQTVEVDDPTRAAEAFLAGSVDASVTWEPYLTQIKTSGKGRVLADTRSLDDRIIDVLVASESAIKDKPELVKKVVDGWMRALVEVHQPRADTFAIMANGLGMREQEFRSNAQGVMFADWAMNLAWLGPQGAAPSRASVLFSDAARLWRATKLSAAPSSPVPYFSSQFLPKR